MQVHYPALRCWCPCFWHFCPYFNNIGIQVYDTLAISLENSFSILLMYPRWDAQYRGSYRTATLVWLLTRMWICMSRRANIHRACHLTLRIHVCFWCLLVTNIYIRCRDKHSCFKHHHIVRVRKFFNNVSLNIHSIQKSLTSIKSVIGITCILSVIIRLWENRKLYRIEI
jgi:hypothetical protein